MARTSVSFTAPSHWASYLINADASGLEPIERIQADAWLAWVSLGWPVDCEDAGFRWRHDASYLGVLACDCQTYTFLTKA